VRTGLLVLAILKSAPFNAAQDHSAANTFLADVKASARFSAANPLRTETVFVSP